MERKTECSRMEAEIARFGLGSRLCEMERRTLRDKGIDGPTMAHVIEEIHTPVNIASITTTTGTSAFQNIVGITYEELPSRIEAGKLALKLSGIQSGTRLLITYPPLVNVFTRQALDEALVNSCFLLRSSKDALLAALCEKKPQAVIGESRFLKGAFKMALDLGLASKLPKALTVIAAGTPMDQELLELEAELSGLRVHDLYGCQEFGWLTLDGIPLRDDLWMPEVSRGRGQVIVGGIPTGDSFLLHTSGRIITRSGQRMENEWESVLYETTVANRVTAERTARTILRLKGRIVRVSKGLITGAPRNVLGIRMVEENGYSAPILCEGKTGMFDDLLKAQMAYQRNGKNAPVWKEAGVYGET